LEKCHMVEISGLKPMDMGFTLGQAMDEAARCLLCHDAPCSKGCPASTDPGTFIRKLALKNITGAIRTIKTNNIMGGSCGVLCPTARLCEKECSASGIDRPIRIGRIQRALVEHGWEIGFNPLPQPEFDGPRAAVVGAGPGGLSCAAELTKFGIKPVVYEAMPEPGGVLRYGVPESRFSLEFLKHEIQDVKSLGVEFKFKQRIEDQAGAKRLLHEGYEAVYLSPGLWGAASLVHNAPLPGGVLSSVDYLLALRDGRLEKMKAAISGKNVAVIGGGSVAMDCVETAAQLGASDVYLIYRRSFAQMPAEEDERLAALRAGVHFLVLNHPVNYLVNTEGHITGISLARTRLGKPDGSGRRVPQVVKDSQWLLEADLVIEAIGNRPGDDLKGCCSGLAFQDELIKADPVSGQTSAPGIYAGGDIVRGRPWW
jgi:NADPH-dependent glutamate synthase beta subunit-like oxidoreductase